jgi:hypothetical protein
MPIVMVVGVIPGALAVSFALVKDVALAPELLYPAATMATTAPAAST